MGELVGKVGGIQDGRAALNERVHAREIGLRKKIVWRRKGEHGS